MKRVAVINGGYYLPLIHEALKTPSWEVTEWETMPLTGYDFVFLFLENIVCETGDSAALRTVRREFLEYVESHPPSHGWVIVAPQDSKDIRKRGVMKNIHRCILDACRFGYQFKKRFRLWSSYPISSVLCNKSCTLARKSLLHDPKTWVGKTQPQEVQYINLLKRYDENQKMPPDMIRYILGIAWGEIKQEVRNDACRYFWE